MIKASWAVIFAVALLSDIATGFRLVHGETRSSHKVAAASPAPTPVDTNSPANLHSTLSAGPVLGPDNKMPLVLGQPGEGRRFEFLGKPDAETGAQPLLGAVVNTVENAYDRGAYNIYGIASIGEGFSILTGKKTLPIFAWTIDIYPDGGGDGNSPWNSPAYAAYNVPNEIQLTSEPHSEHSSSTEVFSNAEEFYKSESKSMGIGVSSPMASSAFSLSTSRSEMTKTFSTSDVAITRQKHEFYKLSILPIMKYDCSQLNTLGHCKTTIDRKKILPSFQEAIDTLPEIKFLRASQMEYIASEPEMKAGEYGWFCFELTQLSGSSDTGPRIFCRQLINGKLKISENPEETKQRIAPKSYYEYEVEGVRSEDAPVEPKQVGLLIAGKDITAEEATLKYAQTAYSFRRFVWHYGTHYIQSAVFGGELNVVTTAEKSEKLTSKQMQMVGEAAVDGAFPGAAGVTAGAEAGMSKEQKEAKEETSTSTSSETTVLGGDVSLAAPVNGESPSKQDWIASIAANPVVVGKTLASITHFLVDYAEEENVTVPVAVPVPASASTGDNGAISLKPSTPNANAVLRFREGGNQLRHPGSAPRNDAKGSRKSHSSAPPLALLEMERKFPTFGDLVAKRKTLDTMGMKRSFMDAQIRHMGDISSQLKVMLPLMEALGDRLSLMSNIFKGLQGNSVYDETATLLQKKMNVCLQLKEKTNNYIELWTVMSGLAPEDCRMTSVTCDFSLDRAIQMEESHVARERVLSARRDAQQQSNDNKMERSGAMADVGYCRQWSCLSKVIGSRSKCDTRRRQCNSDPRCNAGTTAITVMHINSPVSLYCCPADSPECTNSWQAWTDAKADRMGFADDSGVGLSKDILRCAAEQCEEMSVPWNMGLSKKETKRHECEKSIYCTKMHTPNGGYPCCAFGAEESCKDVITSSFKQTDAQKELCAKSGFDTPEERPEALQVNMEANNKKCLRYFCSSLVEAGEAKCTAHPNCMWHKKMCCADVNNCGIKEDVGIWNTWKDQDVCMGCKKCNGDLENLDLAASPVVAASGAGGPQGQSAVAGAKGSVPTGASTSNKCTQDTCTKISKKKGTFGRRMSPALQAECQQHNCVVDVGVVYDTCKCVSE